VALSDSVYLWNAGNGGITQLMQTQGEGSHVTSVAWSQKSNLMAIGTSNSEVQLWDAEKCKLLRNMPGHCARVGALAWNGHLLSSGSRDATITHHDHRAAQQRGQSAALAVPPLATAVRLGRGALVGSGRLHAPPEEVCGLKWAPGGVQLASGGNDNLLNIWDERRVATAPPVFSFDQHHAAVKALAWCPWQKNLLASGGGTADRMIRFWNTNNGAFVNAVDTHSQVCALQWSVHDKEIVSSHGFSHNQLILWKYPHMVKASELTGHTARVLHLAQSPDGTTVVSAAADETLRFWKILSGGSQKTRNRGSEQREESLVSPSAWTGSRVVR
jgi:cell division cycle protein 20 (cofactor of APC complex)